MTKQEELFEEFEKEEYPTAYLNPTSEALHLKSIRVESFKGIRDLEVFFNRISILTGINNSGKSTILQAISLAFEALRMCLNTKKWTFIEGGRAVKEFDLLPVNMPQDLWFERKTKPSTVGETPINLYLRFSDGFFVNVRVRLLYGFLNVRVVDWQKENSSELTSQKIRQIISLSPILIPGFAGVAAHEEWRVPAQINKMALSGNLSAVLRNILLSLQRPDELIAQAEPSPKLQFLRSVVMKYFNAELLDIGFNERRDLEIRALYKEKNYNLDVVSAGSGFNQILTMIAFLLWRDSRIVLLDEPDAHLHTTLQHQLFSFLEEVSAKFNLQVILATHSRDLISQAPIEFVIPVDSTKQKNQPLESIDHLLAEYRRLGPISNPDIALLYQTKKCLFVEGSSDRDWLPLLAEKGGFSCFKGRDQFVIFQFKGVDKVSMVADLVKLFEQVIGGKLKWMVLRDKDYSTEAMVGYYKETAIEKGIDNFHIWQKHSLENYLIEPKILLEAINNKAAEKGRQSLTFEQVIEGLTKACEEIMTDEQAAFIDFANSFWRNKKLEKEHPTAETIKYFTENTSTLEGKLSLLSGSKIFGRFVIWLQKNHDLNLNFEQVIISISDGSRISPELREFFQKIRGL